jgi:hypothetical protein
MKMTTPDATAPVKAGGATAATTDVAGASGGGALPTDLPHVLQQLVDAVGLLTKAISTMGGGAVGGGGPIQVPPGKVGQSTGGGGGSFDPVVMAGSRIDQLLANPKLSPAQRTALQSIKSGPLADVRAEANRNGVFDPVTLMRVNMLVNLEETAGNPTAHAALQKLMPRVDAMVAESKRTGTFNAPEIQSLSDDVARIMVTVPPPLP